ncbi:hypothetical protein [Streptomyces sp. ME18-1-4]|uniref:hypothetical protein n=1 Tax=Streptomyces sp. ME18-1-4 TaxID=3028685 RepID=UPI0029B2D6DC|nr:hypothetical protein [Streptomyces sp. ME18-1-4]MDX3249042.1 hypothetical protein [Streptomyces sp. ME18-1-4]
MRWPGWSDRERPIGDTVAHRRSTPRCQSRPTGHSAPQPQAARRRERPDQAAEFAVRRYADGLAAREIDDALGRDEVRACSGRQLMDVTAAGRRVAEGAQGGQERGEQLSRLRVVRAPHLDGQVDQARQAAVVAQAAGQRVPEVARADSLGVGPAVAEALPAGRHVHDVLADGGGSVRRATLAYHGVEANSTASASDVPAG